MRNLCALMTILSLAPLALPLSMARDARCPVKVFEDIAINLGRRAT